MEKRRPPRFAEGRAEHAISELPACRSLSPETRKVSLCVPSVSNLENRVDAGCLYIEYYQTHPVSEECMPPPSPCTSYTRCPGLLILPDLLGESFFFLFILSFSRPSLQLSFDLTFVFSRPEKTETTAFSSKIDALSRLARDESFPPSPTAPSAAAAQALLLPVLQRRLASLSEDSSPPSPSVRNSAHGFKKTREPSRKRNTDHADVTETSPCHEEKEKKNRERRRKGKDG